MRVLLFRQSLFLAKRHKDGEEECQGPMDSLSPRVWRQCSVRTHRNQDTTRDPRSYRKESHCRELCTGEI